MSLQQQDSAFYGDSVWDQLFGSGSWGGTYPSEEAVRFAVRSRRALGNDRTRALDIGSGKGACAWMLAREGWQVTCFDGSPNALDLLPGIFSKFGVKQSPETLVGNITKPLDYLSDGNKFDLLLDHYSLYSNKPDEIERAYSQYREIAATGALFLTCCFGKRSSGYGTGTPTGPGSYRDIPLGPLSKRGLVTFFSPDEIHSLLRRLGYSIEYYDVMEINGEAGIIEKIITALRCP